MNISKKPSAENDMLMELRFMLAYHLHWDLTTINKFLQFSEKKANLKNFWLQKKEVKDQVKEHDAKLDEIARFVTKYINSRKANNKG